MLWSNNAHWFWDPWDEFERMRRSISRFDPQRLSDFPSVNVWASHDDSVITTEIPGVDPDNIDISITGRTVTLRGSRKKEDLRSDQSFHRRERWIGDFSKTLELPFIVGVDKVKAVFIKGVLYLTLPKADEEKPRKIQITS